jgi:glycerophosphoryl diester phosphodiesterase
MKTWPYPKLFAHRGGGSLAPENTLAGMKKAQQIGYIAVEFDVKLSGDNVAILMHDETLERTTNGTGAVKDKTYRELAGLDAGSWRSASYRGERIPKFTEVAHYLHGMGIMANVELKPCPGREQETGKLVAELCQSLWQDRTVKPLLTSFSFQALEAAHRAVPELPRGFLVGAPAPEHLVQLAALDCVSLNCDHSELDEASIKFFQQRGYRMLTYTVNDPDRARTLLQWGIDGIFTDNLSAMADEFHDAMVWV